MIPLDQQTRPYKLVLAHHRAPGDSLVLSAAIRSLHIQYPGEYVVGLDVTAGGELYLNNPDVCDVDRAGAQFAEIEYGLINQSNQVPVTFMAAFAADLSRIIGRPLSLNTNRPHIVLSDQEKQWKSRVEEILGQKTPYALINAGHKRDYTVKGWGHSNYQRLVDKTRDRIQWVQVGTSNEVHKPLDGVINQIDKTTIRELIRLAYHADFAVGPTTLLQHVCAALQKPYVAILSGMEPLAWSSPYHTQISLSAHGRLPCCRDGACWKARVAPLGDNAVSDAPGKLCELPIYNGAETIPSCMAMITVDRVVEAVEQLLTFRGRSARPDP